MTHELAPSAAEVVIVGGGIAALEALLALSDLAGERVRLTLVAPDPDLVDRPMTVAEPFGFGAPRRHPLERIASNFDASIVRARSRRCAPRSGASCSAAETPSAYDMLVLATGARTLPALRSCDHVRRAGLRRGDARLVDGVERGTLRRVAFIAPTAVGWTLPLYELALLTARAARRAPGRSRASP